MQTVAGTPDNAPSRRARYAWPNPPSPSRRPMRKRIPLCGLVTAWSGARRWRAGLRAAQPGLVRVVDEDDAWLDRVEGGGMLDGPGQHSRTRRRLSAAVDHPRRWSEPDCP